MIVLRQEGRHEQQCLGIGEGDQKAVRENRPHGRTRFVLAGRQDQGRVLAQQAPAQIGQIERASPFKDPEGGFGGGQQHAQAAGHHGDQHHVGQHRAGHAPAGRPQAVSRAIAHG
jgi:hypothetical protein